MPRCASSGTSVWATSRCADSHEFYVEPSALYWHVADKQSLFVLLAARMGAEADDLDRPAPGQGRLASTVDAITTYRGVLLRYRESADIVLLGLLALRSDGAAAQPSQISMRTPATS